MIKNRMFKTAAAVPSLKVADPVFNSEQIIRIMKENSDCGLIVFPELSVTGYTCADLFQQDLLLARAEKCLLKIAEATQGTSQTAVVGVPIRFENRLYNCAAFLSNGEVCALVPKVNIPNYSEFYEERWFASGKDVIAVVKADGYGLGDLAVARSAMDAGAKMLAVSSCDEAMILRNKGYKDQLLILGHTDTVDLPQLIKKQVAVPAYSPQWVKNAVEAGCEGLRVHIKVDTGMNRIGFKDSAEIK